DRPRRAPVGSFRYDRVGQVEQAADQDLVALDPLAHQPPPTGRGTLDDEPALRPDRHDDRVLDRLRLHQAEDLAAEILLAIGPADAAAGDLAGAHMDAFRAWAVNVDLVKRTRRREEIERAGGKLDREHRLRFTIEQRLIIIRPHGFQHEG